MIDLTTMPQHLRRTIGNPRWMLANAERLRSLLPEHWTPLHEINAIELGVQLRHIGVRWQNEIELTLTLATLQAAGVMRLATWGSYGGGAIEVVRRGPLVIQYGTAA